MLHVWSDEIKMWRFHSDPLHYIQSWDSYIRWRFYNGHTTGHVAMWPCVMAWDHGIVFGPYLYNMITTESNKGFGVCKIFLWFGVINDKLFIFELIRHIKTRNIKIRFQTIKIKKVFVLFRFYLLFCSLMNIYYSIL